MCFKIYPVPLRSLITSDKVKSGRVSSSKRAPSDLQRDRRYGEWWLCLPSIHWVSCSSTQQIKEIAIVGSDGVDLKPRSLVTILWSRSIQTHCVGRSPPWLSLLHSEKITVIIAPFWHLIPVTTHLRSPGQRDPARRVRKIEAVPSIVLCPMAWTNQRIRILCPRIIQGASAGLSLLLPSLS